jgi:hypothetical protein
MGNKIAIIIMVITFIIAIEISMLIPEPIKKPPEPYSMNCSTINVTKLEDIENFNKVKYKPEEFEKMILTNNVPIVCWKNHCGFFVTNVLHYADVKCKIKETT